MTKIAMTKELLMSRGMAEVVAGRVLAAMLLAPTLMAAADNKYVVRGFIALDDDWDDGATGVPENLAAFLAESSGDVSIVINSDGGNYAAGLEMRQMLVDHPGEVSVKIITACSAAALLATGGNKIAIAEGGLVMIHPPMTLAMGTAADMRATAERLDVVEKSMIPLFAKRMEMTTSAVKTKIEQGDWWMSAEDAVEAKFCDEVLVAEKEPVNNVLADAGLAMRRGRAQMSLRNRLVLSR